MTDMFLNASAFNQNLSAWNFESVSQFGQFLNNSALANLNEASGIYNYNQFLLRLASQNVLPGVAPTIDSSPAKLLCRTRGNSAHNADWSWIHDHRWRSDCLERSGCARAGGWRHARKPTDDPLGRAERPRQCNYWLHRHGNPQDRYGYVSQRDVYEY